MRLDEIVVEVRDAQYQRVGVILPEDLNLTGTTLFNNVGEWELSLPEDHPVTETLQTPGAGIVVSSTVTGRTIMSGPVLSPSFAATPQDTRGTITFKGATDDLVLMDRLAYPDPTNPDVTTQAVTHDTVTASVEDVLRHYVRRNIGPDATPERQHPFLRMADSGHSRGGQVTKSARFPVLGTLLSETCLGSTIGFRVVQGRGAVIDFETFEARNRVHDVRLSISNSGLAGMRTTLAAPAITRAILGGSDETTGRALREAVNNDSEAAEGEWGRRIERFVNAGGGTLPADATQEQIDEAEAELVKAGAEALAEGGFTQFSAELVPAESATQGFGVDWDLGDKVSVEANSGMVLEGYVAGAAFAANAEEGFIFGVILSDSLTVMTSREVKIERRLSQVERETVPVLEIVDDATTALDLEIQARIDDVMKELEALEGNVEKVTTSANGKATSYYSASAPTGGTYRVGDMWFESDNNYKLRVWNGSTWADPISAMLTPIQTDLNNHSQTLTDLNADLAAANQELDAILPITSTKITDDAITTPKIKTGAIISDHITVNTLNGDRIAVNTLHGDKVIANTIAASKIAVTDFNDYIPDPHFDRPEAWGLPSGFSFSTLTTPPPETTNKVSVAIGALGQYAQMTFKGDNIPVTPGDEYVLSSVHKTSGTMNGSYYIAVYYYDKAGTYLNNQTQGLSLTGGGAWVYTDLEAKAPANAASMKPFIVRTAGATTGGLYIDQWHLRQKNNGQLIVDGTITSDHIVVEGLDAGLIKFGELDGARIKTDTLDGRVIKAGTLAANTIAVADFTNLLPPMLEWNSSTAATTNSDVTGPYCIIQGNGSGNTHISMGAGSDIPVYPGEQLRFEWTCYVNYSGYSGSVVPYFQWLKGDYSLLTAAAGAGTPQGTNSYARTTLDLVAPAGAAYLRFIPYAQANARGAIRGAFLRRKNGGELIVDGAIKADHLDANAITGNTIKGGTISGVTISGNTITGGTITGTTITGNTITGGSISGTTITGSTLTTPQEGTGRYTAAVAYGTYVTSTGTPGSWAQTTDGGSSQFFGEPTAGGWRTGIRNWHYNATQAEMLIQGSEFNFRYQSATGQSTLRAGVIEAQAGLFTAVPTVSASANAYMSSGNQLCKVSSSRRYKSNITDMPADVDALLALRPVEFNGLNELDDPDERFIGFIAEEAEELGLTQWVEYGEDGRVEGFKYANWTAALQKIARSQQERIEDLEARLADLEN